MARPLEKQVLVRLDSLVKGRSHEIFDLRFFFSWIQPPSGLIRKLKLFLIWHRICWNIQLLMSFHAIYRSEPSISFGTIGHCAYFPKHYGSQWRIGLSTTSHCADSGSAPWVTGRNELWIRSHVYLLAVYSRARGPMSVYKWLCIRVHWAMYPGANSCVSTYLWQCIYIHVAVHHQSAVFGYPLCATAQILVMSYYGL